KLREHGGVLEWGADDRIRLYDIKRFGGEPQRHLVFDVALHDIKDLQGFVGTLIIRTKSAGTYWILFSPGITTLLAGGVLGFLLASKMEKAVGLTAWVDRLKSHGIKDNYENAMRMLIFTTIFGIVSGLLLVAVVAVIVKMNPDVFRR